MTNTNELNYFTKEAVASGYSKGISKEEELNLIIKAQAGNSAAENKLVMAFTFFIISIVNEFKTKHLEKSDLMIAGQMGLVKAIRKFNTKCGGRLSTYANQWIRKCIRDEIADNEFTIRTPQNVQAERRLYNNYLAALPESMSDSEKSEYADRFSGLSKKRINNLKSAAVCETSLDDFLYSESESETRLSFVTGYSCQDPAIEYERKELCERVKEFKENVLNAREAQVANARNGFGQEVALSLNETAKEMGVSKSTVRDIERKISKKAREEESIKYFEGYIDQSTNTAA